MMRLWPYEKSRVQHWIVDKKSITSLSNKDVEKLNFHFANTCQQLPPSDPSLLTVFLLSETHQVLLKNMLISWEEFGNVHSESSLVSPNKTEIIRLFVLYIQSILSNDCQAMEKSGYKLLLEYPSWARIH